MNEKNWTRIIEQVQEFVDEFDTPWEGEYAVLLSKDEKDIDFRRLPNASESFWGKELPWKEIGKISGTGNDGMAIHLKYNNFKFFDKGLFNINID